MLRFALIVSLSLVCTGAWPNSPGQAQDSGPSAAAASAPASAEPSVQSAQPKKKRLMNGYAFGLQLGIAHVGTGDVRNPTYVQTSSMIPSSQLEAAGLIGEGCTILDRRCRTEARRGVQLAFPIQVGGPIVGFRLEPYLTLARAAKAYGIYMGPTFDFQVMRPLYLGFGFGLKAAWVKDDDWKYAADIYGRLPMRVTYYILDGLALVLEFGIGVGASGYVRELRDIIDPRTGRRIARSTDMTFGFGRTWDLTLGFRFP